MPKASSAELLLLQYILSNKLKILWFFDKQFHFAFSSSTSSDSIVMLPWCRNVSVFIAESKKKLQTIIYFEKLNELRMISKKNTLSWRMETFCQLTAHTESRTVQKALLESEELRQKIVCDLKFNKRMSFVHCLRLFCCHLKGTFLSCVA